MRCGSTAASTIPADLSEWIGIMLSCAVFYQIAMKGYSLGALLSAVLLFGSCQRQQYFLFRPAGNTHSSVAAVAREPLAPASEPAATPAPELLAELPTASSNPPKPTRAYGAMPSPTATVKAPVASSIRSAALQIMPDTSLVRQATKTPLHKIKETDLLTKIARVIGVLFILLGVAAFVVAFSTTSGWTILAFLLYGFAYLLISIPFMVFRGKNSPRRQELKRRRAARKAAASQ